MEIEEKYRVVGKLSPQRITSADLHPYVMKPAEDERHHDSLLDTPDRVITGSGYALRIRETGKRRILTLKGPPLGEGALHRREEIEADLDADSPGPAKKGRVSRARWPEPIKSMVSEMIGEEHLLSLIHTDIHRTTWKIERAGRVIAELAYDVGEVSANGKSDAINELEIELKGAGDESDLRTLGERLRALTPLEPESRTKLSRGLDLLPRQRPDPGRRDLHALASSTVAAALRKYHKREHEARAGDDPEGVHDVRVAVRRLRSALALLESAPGFDADDLKRWRKRLKGLAAALGAVRDLDVQLERLSAYRETHPELRDGLQPIWDEMTHERDKARGEMLDALDDDKIRDTLKTLHGFATEQPEEDSDDETILVRHFAGGAVWRRYEDVLRHECQLPTESAPVLHEIRIACKRQRYALEMFAHAFGSHADPLIALLVTVQDCLGAHQDCVVARGYLERSQAEASDQRALAVYDDALATEQIALRAQFRRLWAQLSGKAFRRDFAALIAAL
ncbi:MAG TPA: CHAD domain-containing protein [Ktedonobacterales bacterium]|nr:CHAD domain-containing protein [Ktedonobacterales bacterium]